MALRIMAQLSLLLLSLSGCSWFVTPAVASSWGYEEGKNGPKNWPGMCKSGSRQSPIDLHPDNSTPAHFEPLVLFNYDKKVVTRITNNGHTVMLTVEQPCDIAIAAGGLPGVYILDQIHFHWKSEHTLKRERFPLEMHIVHHNKKYSKLSEAAKHHDGIAVIGVLFFISNDQNKGLKPIIEALPEVSHPDNTVHKLPEQLDLEKLLPYDTNRFYRYQGSLTTPNCDESVVWTVLTNLVPIGEEQVEEFHKIKSSHHQELKTNYRPIQKLDKRRIFLQHPHEAFIEFSLSSTSSLSWCLVFVCGLMSYWI